MNLTTTTAGTVPATMLARARAHLRFTDSDTSEDTLISELINVAINDIEKHTGRALWNTVYAYKLPAFPDKGTLNLSDFPRNVIELPRAPLVSVASVTYTDADGGEGNTYSSDNYFLDKDTNHPRIILKDTADWPETEDYNPEAVTIAFTAGYGTSFDDVPKLMIAGILFYVSELFEYRTGKGVDNLEKVRTQFFDRFRNFIF
jgi:uncharacterized phiE125 gp8 family phage protein